MSSSGGNAGLAASYCAKELSVPITVVVPESTPDFVREKMKQYGANVEPFGNVRKFYCDMAFIDKYIP